MALSVRTVDPTANEYIDGILSGVAWTDSVPIVLTNSYPGAAGNYGVGYGVGETASGFAQFTTAQQTFCDGALLDLSKIIPVTFTEIAEDDSTHAVIRFGNSSVPNPAHAYYPASLISQSGGDVWIDPNQFSLGTPVVGRYTGYTHLHEIGHALGLKHAHETVGSFGTVPSDKDAMEYTAMSYRSYPGASVASVNNETDGFISTFMTLDILALQYMYGAAAAGSGSITYHFNPSTGVVSRNGSAIITPSANRIFMTQPPERTSGIISWDCSGYTTDLDIDLRPGMGSVLSNTQIASLGNSQFAAANIYIPSMYGGETDAMPTRVILGSGADTIIGNSKTNTIKLNGNRLQYTFGTSGPNYTLQRSGEGMKTFTGIELFEFNDGTFPFYQVAGTRTVAINVTAL